MKITHSPSSTDYTIDIHVQSFFLPDQSQAASQTYAFGYTVTITNQGQIAAQLIARYWTIEDSQGSQQQIHGLGVVGVQPLLNPGESFQYTSGCQLRTSFGTMHGHYFFVASDGHHFECPIPLFILRTDNTVEALH